MPGKASGGIIGYKYYLGMHMVLCLKMDALVGIKVGDRQLWNGATGSMSAYNVTGIAANQDLDIHQEALFGGDAREGGIAGKVGVQFGDPAQGIDPYLQKQFGSLTSAYRGVVSIILKKIYIGVNPYLKDWAFLVRRIPCSDWLPTIASITSSTDGHLDANPAHIIRWYIISPEVGLGYSASLIGDSFTASASKLYSEGFGLSFIWDKESSIQDFIQTVLNHINGVLYVDQTTGKFELKLLRADYVVSSLMAFDESNCVIEEFQRAAFGETSNEVTVQYTNRYTGGMVSTTVQDLANMQVQKAIVSQTKQYPGISDANLAIRVAQRDLQTYSTPLSKGRIKVNRVAWNLNIGDVFKFSWASLGIASVVFRIADIDRGTLEDGTIVINMVEDVFGLPVSTYVTYQPTGWVPPYSAPAAASTAKVSEASYWDIVKRFSTTVADSLHPAAAFATAFAARPSQDARAFEFQVSGGGATGPYDTSNTGYFCPSCVLTSGLVPEVSTTVGYTGDTDFQLLSVGDWGYVEEEIVQIAAIGTGTLTLNRGIFDTVPAAHPTSSRLYLCDTLKGYDSFEYTAGETVYGKVMPTTALGTLALTSATALARTLVGRPYLPYPPGNLKVNGAAYPASITGPLTLTWAHRSRTQQTAGVALQTDTNIGPEAGVTYTVRLYGEAGTLLHTETGIAGTTYQWASEIPDSGLGRLNGALTATVQAVRGGYSSWQLLTWSGTRTGDLTTGATAVSPPTALTASGGVGTVTWTWTRSSSADSSELVISSSSSFSSTSAISVSVGAATSYTFSTPTVGTYYAWVRERNASGASSTFYPATTGVGVSGASVTDTTSLTGLVTP